MLFRTTRGQLGISEKSALQPHLEQDTNFSVLLYQLVATTMESCFPYLNNAWKDKQAVMSFHIYEHSTSSLEKSYQNECFVTLAEVTSQPTGL